MTGNGKNSIPDILDDGGGSITFAGDIAERHRVGLVEPSPCTDACPAGVNVKSYVSLIASRRFKEALAVVRDRNPLPGICGRVCTHPCESYCNRIDLDSAVAICKLKRFVADYELENPPGKSEPFPRTKDAKVAVIGSGPAGLTVAYDLVRAGYGVTVFEALPKAGGMLIVGIPSFRLPRSIIEAEIEYIRDAGVEIRTNERISGKRALEGLFDEDYKAVYIAVGAHEGKKLGIPGEDEYEGMLDCVEFLREVNLGKAKKPGRNIIVIGGGNSAIDSARTALRLGCDKVHIVYRRTRKEMPAEEEEIREAEEEGVEIHYLAAPVRMLGEKGKLTGMECLKMQLGEPDESGRRRPVPIEGSEFVLETDVVIPAISQKPDLSFLPEAHDLELSKWQTIGADEKTAATNRPGVFAGGDAVTGPNTVIDAIADGHVASRSIDRYLRGLPLEFDHRLGKPLEAEIEVDILQRKKASRVKMPMIGMNDRRKSFNEVYLGFSQDDAVKEAQRCLRCGPCSECLICVSECDKNIGFISSTNGESEGIFRFLNEFDGVELTKTREGTLTGEKEKGAPLSLVPLTCYVKEDLCRSCGDCISVCEYAAPAYVPGDREFQVVKIDESLCKGCGTCAAVCPTNAIEPRYFTTDWLRSKLQRMDSKKKNLLVLTCMWNGVRLDDSFLSDVDMDGIDVEYGVTLCAGRIEPSFVLEAFSRGVDGVFIRSCGIEDCHYVTGARQVTHTYGRIEELVRLLGIEPERIRYEQIPAAEGARFAEAVGEFAGGLKAIGKRKFALTRETA